MGGLGLNDEVVDVIVPLAPRYASTLRTMTASFGVDTGFSIDEIDDLKLAVTEAFSMLVARHAGRRARASFAVAPTALTVRLSLESGLDILVQPDDLALAILRAVVDSFDVGKSAITLHKGAVETSLISR
jgi:serine/threonine-protein kinase RsbW